MAGGIRAWEGLVASGAPESGMAYFSSASRPEELIRLAWILEEGSRIFYAGVHDLLSDEEARNLFSSLVKAEEHHKQALIKQYEEVAGERPSADFPSALIGDETKGDVMEGGMRVSEALAWVRGKDREAILELSLALEANAYDLYLRMERQMKDEKSKRVFSGLAAEEKVHLERLGELLDRSV